MATNKTTPTDASVSDYLGAIDSETRRRDCEVLVLLLAKATGAKAKMWGSSIVGFGTHTYKYASGKDGEICLVGFSSRKGDISIYGTGAASSEEGLLERLGKHKMGKGCLYIGKLIDVDLKVLEQLITSAVRAKRVETCD